MARLEFTTATQREALRRSNGICECHRIPHVFKVACGLPLGTGNTFFEHIDCDALRQDNSLENCAVLTKTCWRFKTDNFDKPVIAKAQRNFDRNNGIKDPWKKRLPGGKHSSIKIRIGKPPVDRRTGRPIFGVR